MISFSDNPGGEMQQDPAPRETKKKTKPLDTSNRFGVGSRGNVIVINSIYAGMPLTLNDAVNLAAWLMVTADPTGEQFERVVKEIVKS